MLAVLSPAKTLDLDRSVPAPRATRPRLLDRSERLVEVLRGYSPARLGKLMKINPDLSRLNAERFERFETPFTVRNARRAIVAFAGDVYRGLDVESLDRDDLAFAQQRLRIISGLYGILRPLDLMQPYRLEMSTSLSIDGHRSLYEFWGDEPTDVLRRDLRRHESRALINLASAEYFKAIRPEAVGGAVITPVFKQRRDGGDRVVPVLAERARGLMAHYIVRERLDDPEGLRGFDLEGYRYAARASSDDEWVFVRRA